MPVPNFQATTILSYLGIVALFVSALLILGAIGVLSTNQIAKGRKTLVAGIILAIAGIILVLPDIKISSGSTPPTEAAASNPDTNAARKETNTPTSTVSPLPIIFTDTPTTTNTAEPTSTPTSIVAPTSTPTVLVVTAAFAENLGLCQYGVPCDMPEPAGPGKAIVAHGDITNSGSCNVRVFGPGEQVQGLGNGTFRLVRITGSPEQIMAKVEEIQTTIGGGNKDNCPQIH